MALKVYDRLNRDYNLDDRVPIYQIGREIGERASRSQFNKWLSSLLTTYLKQEKGRGGSDRFYFLRELLIDLD